MEIDITTCSEIEQNDGYDDIREFFQPTENIDFQKLVDNEIFLWTTAKGDIYIIYEIGNVLQIKVRDDISGYGYSYTYDFDTYGLVYCVMSALRDYIKDIERTFVNIPVE